MSELNIYAIRESIDKILTSEKPRTNLRNS
ncbi:Methylthioribose-1-phosphate isomerase [Gossypium arboreum]|uniref:Methylthioribose-1-phosphate isomerase n=1 Tax=Gossypium arboreum TaxID=29729 RepID=A0A0B0P7P3_GOSAR|nr:Methylthioribose-1-phosphate isomerase [Gossypium arboreum]